MNAKVVAVVSILLNVALAGGVVYLSSRRASVESSPAQPPTPQAVSAPKTEPKPESQTVTVVASQPGRLFDWRMVESEDYRKYIANLRTVGCPEETIRDIITADVNKLFEQRRKQITASTNKFEYWKSSNMFGQMGLDPDRIEKLQQLAREKRDLLRELLGVEPEEKPELFANFNPFESMLDFLPAAKQNEIMDVYMKFQAKMAKSFSGGMPDAEDMKAMQKAQKEMEAELAGMMSPEEFREYQLRMSQTAMTMRMQLAGFDPTQAEFDKIFDTRKKFDDEYSLMGGAGATKEERDKRAAAQKELDAQLKAVLGDARFAEYQRSQDWSYQTIYRVTDKYGLPKDSATKVYDMQKAAQDEAKRVRSDKTMTKEQQQDALMAVRAETEKSIHSVLGDKAWNSYNSQGAYWLNGISPEQKPSDAVPAAQ